MVYTLNPTKYPNSQAKVIFAATYLRGNAFQWFEPHITAYLNKHIDNDTKKIFSYFTIFEKELQRVYSSTNDEYTVAQQIHMLKQKGSTTQYYSNFQSVAARLDQDDKALAAIFYQGLSDSIKDKMMPSSLADFDQLVDEAIQIDNHLYERRMEKGGMYTTSYRQGKGHYNGEDSMDLDALHDRPSRLGKYRDRGKPLEKTERERYRRDRLCYNCGKSRYQAKEYKAERLHVIEDNQAGTIAKKADTIKKIKETQEALSIVQKGSEREVRKDETFLIERIASPGALKMKAIADVGKKSQTKYLWDIDSEKDTKHGKLLQTIYFNDTCPIHRSDKKGSGQFPQELKSKSKKKQVSWPSWHEELSDEELAQNLVHFESLCMMEAPPPYERRFEVINWHQAAVVICTTYQVVTENPPIRVMQYDADVSALKHEEVVMLRTCYDPRHADNPQHSYDVRGKRDRVVTSIERPQLLHQITDTLNLPDFNTMIEKLGDTLED